MIFKIKNRWSMEVQFACELAAEFELKSYGIKLSAAIKKAIKAGADLQDAYLRGADLEAADLQDANLRGANLRGANLQDADLRGADLQDAYLRGADLQDADLQDANLRGANLRGADLQDAYLRGADLQDADLRGADLRGADLQDADLQDADLRGADLQDADLQDADLRDANLRDANLRRARTDLFDILLRVPNEIDALAQALRDGRVNGSAYEGDCACLVGTIANARKCSYSEIPNLAPESSRPAERWFLAIKEGNTPENSNVVKITLKWIEEFQWLLQAIRSAA